MFFENSLDLSKYCYFSIFNYSIRQTHLIKRPRLRLKHLWFIKSSFQDTLNHVSNCGNVETTIHNFPHCTNFPNERLTIFNKLRSIDENILIKNDSKILKVLLFGEASFNGIKNTCFNCNNWIHHFKKTFSYSLISTLFHIDLSMCKLFLVFIKKCFVNLFYMVLLFLCLRLFSLNFFWK